MSAVRARPLLAIAALALLLRVALVLASPGYAPAQDAAEYNVIAQSIAHGHGYPLTYYAEPGTASALRPPAWPVLLAATYAVTGDSWTAARLVEALLGTLAVVLVFLIGRELWSRRVGLVAAAVAAVFPPLILANNALLSEPLFVPLVLASVLAVVRLRRRPSLRWALLAGVLGGLAALTRPVGLPLLLVLAAGAWAAAGGRPWRARAAPALGVLAGAAVTIAPWTVRSSVELHALVPISTQDGITAYGTYNPVAASRDAVWQVPVWLPDVRPLLPHNDEAELDSKLGGRAVDYATSHPAYPFKALGLNSLRIWAVGPDQAAIQRNGYEEMSVPGWLADVAKASGWLLALLSLAAAAVLWRSGRRRPLAVLWLAPAVMWVSALSVNAVPRFRTPVDPFLILLLAVAADALLAARAGGPRPRRAQAPPA